jgi:hypothetical protein
MRGFAAVQSSRFNVQGLRPFNVQRGAFGAVQGLGFEI